MTQLDMPGYVKRRDGILRDMSRGVEAETGSEDTTLVKRIGEEIRRLRRDQGLTQRELASRAEIVQQNLSLYERGEAAPRLSTLARLLDALDAELRILPKGRSSLASELSVGLSAEELLDFIDRQVQRALTRRERSA